MTEPLNVLIIEDRSDNTERVITALRQDGFKPQVQVVATREGYLAHLSPELDLILADYTLPAFDAPTALRLLNESGLDVPLVVVSDAVGEEQAVALMRQGAADCLLKDRLARLGEAVRRALNERALREEKRLTEAALMASEARFRRLAENAPDIIYRWRVTEPVGFEYISPAVETILGYPPESFYERTDLLLDIIHPDDRELLRQMLAGEWSSEPITVRMQRKDGATVWLERRSAAIRATDGELIAAEGVIRDISKRKRMELALHDSQARLQAIFDNAQDAILLIDDKMRCIAANPAACKLLGYEREELLTLSMVTILPYRDDEAVKDSWRRLIATGLLSGEYIIQRKGGDTIFTEYRAVANIEPGVHLSVIRDVSEHKVAEEALHDSQARLQAIFDNAQDAIMLTDDDARYIGVNPAACKLLGYEREELLTMSMADITPGKDDESIKDSWRSLIAKGVLYGEHVIQRKGGDTFFIEYRAVANIEPGVHLSVIRDISERKVAEEALRQSERRFRQLFETAPIPLVMVGAVNRTVLAANERFAAAVELPVDDLVGRDVMSLGDIEKMDVPFDRLTQEPVRDYELHVDEDRNGREVWLLLSSEPVMLEDGPAVLASFQGITPLKEAQQAERAQREFAEALSANALDFHRTLSLEQTLDRILDSVQSVIGFDTASITLIRDSRLHHGAQVGYGNMDIVNDLLAEYDVEDLAGIREALKTGEPVWVADVADYADWVSMPGLEWLKSFIVAPVLLEGRAIGVLGVASREVGAFSGEDAAHLRAFSAQAATAISNARLYEELEEYSNMLEQAVKERTAELEQAKEQAESILNHSPDPILLLKADGTIRAGNPAFERLFGYTVDELFGRQIATLVISEQRETLRQMLRSIAGRREPARLEVTAIDKNGGPFDTHLSLSPIGGGNGTASSVVCSFHDISALKEVQRMKDAFVSTATHELRTPLTSVTGFSELLLTRELSADRQMRYVQLIHEQASHLALVIDDMLDLAKLTAGRGLEIAPQSVEMEPLIREVLATFRDVSPEHTFRVQICQDIPTVPGDPFRLNQVMRNLVSNAVKYSPGGGAVMVDCQVLADHLLVSVADEGIGMTPEQQAHLFEEFYRADHAVKGTGLGLRISQLIVQGHNGWIWAESEYGVGSTFYFTLPFEEEET